MSDRPHASGAEDLAEDARIVLLVCDPRTLYAYWISAGTYPTRSASAGELVVRLHDLSAEELLGDERKVCVDYRCSRGPGVLSHVEPERCYQAELGVVDVAGIWYSLATSNRVQTPAEGPGEWTEGQFAAVPWQSDLSKFQPPERLSQPIPPRADPLPGWTVDDRPGAAFSARMRQGGLTPQPEDEGTMPVAAEPVLLAQLEEGDLAPDSASEAAEPDTAAGPWLGNERVRRAALPFGEASRVGGGAFEHVERSRHAVQPFGETSRVGGGAFEHVERSRHAAQPFDRASRFDDQASEHGSLDDRRRQHLNPETAEPGASDESAAAFRPRQPVAGGAQQGRHDSPAAHHRLRGSSRVREVEPLPLHGVPRLRGQVIVSARPGGAASAALAGDALHRERS
jgi:hypothetical protein